MEHAWLYLGLSVLDRDGSAGALRGARWLLKAAVAKMAIERIAPRYALESRTGWMSLSALMATGRGFAVIAWRSGVDARDTWGKDKVASPPGLEPWNHRLGGGSYILFNYRELAAVYLKPLGVPRCCYRFPDL